MSTTSIMPPSSPERLCTIPTKDKHKQNNLNAFPAKKQTGALIINSYPTTRKAGRASQVFNLAVNINNNARAMHTSM